MKIRTQLVSLSLLAVACGGDLTQDSAPPEQGNLNGVAGPTDPEPADTPADTDEPQTSPEPGGDAVTPNPLGSPTPQDGTLDPTLPTTPLPAPEPPPLPAWSASIGSWCGPADDQTVWLVANPDASACGVQAPNIYGEGELEGFSVELTAEQLGQMPASLVVPVRYCENRLCETIEATLDLTGYTEGAGAAGSWQLTLSDGVILDGTLDADWCDWDEHLPPHPEGNRLAGAIRIEEVAIYQAVKIQLVENTELVEDLNAPIVAGRPGLVRVFVTPEDDFEPHEIRARLTLQNPDEEEPQVFDQMLMVEEESFDSSLNSTFNFEVPGDVITPDTSFSVELLETTPCAETGDVTDGARFPPSDYEDLRAIVTGPIKVEVVPVRFEDFLPDTSDEQMELFERRLMQVFPVSSVELTVREEPVTTNSSRLDVLLDQMRELRSREEPPLDVSYYGLVNYTDTFRQYCSGSCVLGIAGLPRNLTGGTGTGIGYSGEISAATFVHEVGHVYGRQHSPCNVGGDSNYPYPGGAIGSWGYDIFEGDLYEPDEFADFMSYCNPTWVSDYVYAELAEFSQGLNERALQNFIVGTPTTWRSMLLRGDEPPTWGLTRELLREPEGLPETAYVVDSFGQVVETVTVYRTVAADSPLNLVDVPEPNNSNWWGIRLASGELLDFAKGPSIDPLY